MVTKLLWLEAGICAGLAFLLLIFPHIFSRLLGWPAASGYWPRLLGALLAGVAIATGADQLGWTQPGSRGGVGLAGYIAINIALVFVLVSLLVVGEGLPTRRGRFFGWMSVIGFTLLALVEIGHL
mgnify:CR=1 FL=1